MKNIPFTIDNYTTNYLFNLINDLLTFSSCSGYLHVGEGGVPLQVQVDPRPRGASQEQACGFM